MQTLLYARYTVRFETFSVHRCATKLTVRLQKPRFTYSYIIYSTTALASGTYYNIFSYDFVIRCFPPSSWMY